MQHSGLAEHEDVTLIQEWQKAILEFTKGSRSYSSLVDLTISAYPELGFDKNPVLFAGTNSIFVDVCNKLSVASAAAFYHVRTTDTRTGIDKYRVDTARMDEVISTLLLADLGHQVGSQFGPSFRSVFGQLVEQMLRGVEGTKITRENVTNFHARTSRLFQQYQHS